MFLRIRNVELYAPEPRGRGDLLVAGDRIAAAGELPAGLEALPGLEELDGRGRPLVPGFLDNHVHVLGGGGEGGPRTRTPELPFSDLAEAGVTSLIGLLGTDDVTRHTAALVAKVRALEEEGVSAWALLGSYQLPIRTLTGGIADDLVLVDRLIGVGEVALSDHRSSQPSFEEFLRVAAAARVGGMLAGKGGKVNVHMGDGPRGLEMLRRAARETEIPIDQFLPTHVNRNPSLFEEAIAYALEGGHVDLTTSTTPQFLAEGEVKCSAGLRRLLDAGVPPERISFSSDAQGSLPDFDAAGRLRGLTVGRVRSLWEEGIDSVREGVPLETVLRVVSTSPAAFHRLGGKGRIRVGGDADLVLLDGESLEVRTVIARGRILKREGEVRVRGTFEG
jgi:beta-aspartyl-dipeptidase (metallo-type)